MAIYTIELDGKQFDIEGPDDATQDELYKAAVDFEQLSPKKSGLKEMISTASSIIPQGPMQIGQTAYDLSQKAANWIGEKGAEAMAEKGANPYVSAAAGTVAQMAPDILMSLTPGIAEEGASKISSMLKRAPSVTDDLVKTIPNIEQDLGQLTVRKAGLKSRMLAARKAAEEELGKVKQGIQQYESSAGLSPKEITQLPADFDKTAAKLASMTAKDLAEAAPLETLQEWNKTASLARRSADPASRVIYDKVKTVTTEAQDLLKPGIKGLRESFSTAKKGIEAIPSTFKAEEASLAEQIARKQLSLKEAKAMLPKPQRASFTKKMLKLGLKGMGGGVAAKVGWELLK